MWEPADEDEPDEEVEFEYPEEEKDGEQVLVPVSDGFDGEMGYTEYALISLWLAFTLGIFGLLYRITNEADEEHRKNAKRI